MQAHDLLLDTHVVIWMATTTNRLPDRLLKMIERAAHRFVSHVTALEIQLKNVKNPAAFPFSLQHLEQCMREYSCTELPITYADISMLRQMNFLHPDPFDRLLMAQARIRNLYLTTLDKDILLTFERHKAFRILM